MSVFSPGLRLHDRFTLVERIGAGGMSEVWRATDDVLGREVAVKALVTPLAGEPGLREATWREARAAARLTHPNVTQVHDYGELPLPGGGAAGYLVMELVTGESLAARLARGPMPWPEAVQMSGQVAAALAAAHRLGVVHRDIKPGNVMLTDTGVKVLDFGIASVTGRTGTDPGRLLGTPRYAAPERLDPDSPTAPASDVYSLGVVLYEALAGRPLTRSQSWREAAAAHRSGAAAAPRLAVAGLPERVRRLCETCLSPDPADRPSAAQVASELAAGGPAEEGSPLPGKPGTGEPSWKAAVRPAAALPETRLEEAPARGGRRVPLLLGTLAVLALLGLGVALLFASLRSGGEDAGAPGGGTVTGTGTPPAPPTQTPAQAPRQTPPRTAAGTAAAELVGELDQQVRTAFNQGAITRDGFDELRDEVAELREAIAEDDPRKRDQEVRKAAGDMREEVDDLLADGEIDGSTAEILISLLDQLLDA